MLVVVAIWLALLAADDSDRAMLAVAVNNGDT